MKNFPLEVEHTQVNVCAHTSRGDSRVKNVEKYMSEMTHKSNILKF